MFFVIDQEQEDTRNKRQGDYIAFIQLKVGQIYPSLNFGISRRRLYRSAQFSMVGIATKKRLP